MFGNLTPIVKNLLVLNIAVFFFTGPLADAIGIAPYEYLALREIGSEYFFPLQYFSYMFMHGGFQHLLFNMIALFFFGPLLEQFLGQKRFLILYIVSGLGAGIIHSGISYYEYSQEKASLQTYMTNPTPEGFEMHIKDHYGKYMYLNLYDFIESYSSNPEVTEYKKQSISVLKSLNDPDKGRMVGASGAIMGLLLAFALMFPNTELYLLFIPFPVKAKYMVGFYILMDIFGAIQNDPGDTVAHYAHLGGAFVGFVIVEFWKRQRNRFY